MAYKLSKVAEKQIIEIRYALGCTQSEAINHALESQHAFEQITEDQVLNWLDTHHSEKYKEWQSKYQDEVSKTPIN